MFGEGTGVDSSLDIDNFVEEVYKTMDNEVEDNFYKTFDKPHKHYFYTSTDINGEKFIKRGIELDETRY